jgi:MKL/myocardin-like protein
LKAKIQQRPNREELERRHILEHHESHIDPSLADKRKMLEKAILVDQLNSKISHRPGPLELIEKNILHANEPIERIVKEGLLVGNNGNFLSFEDDSQSSESDQFQQQQQQARTSTSILTTNEVPTLISEIKEEIREFEHEQPQTFGTTPTQGIILVPANTTFTTSSIPLATIKIQNICSDKIEPPALNIPKPPPPPKLITYHVKPVIQTQVKGIINSHQNLFPIQIETSQNTILPTTSINATTQAKVVQSISSNNQKFSAPGKEKNRKKSKNKIIAKRAIKFHEYKGPSNKNNSTSSSNSISLDGSGANKKIAESNYELIMQQQCLLEYLEGIYKNPNSMQMKFENDSIKHTSKPIKVDNFDEKDDKFTKISNKPHVTIFPSKPSTQTSIVTNHLEVSKESATVSDISKLSKMKVSELKAYLKRFNLPVSGPKPLLIERLKPYLPLKHLDDDDASVSSNVVSESNDVYCTTLNSVSSNDSEMDNMEAQFNQVSSSSKEEDIVAEQQRKIEELQQKLQQSQMELEKMKQFKSDPMSQSSSSNSVPSLLNSSDAQADDDDTSEQQHLLQQHTTNDSINLQEIEQQNVQKINQKSLDEIVLAKESNEVTSLLTPLPLSQDLTEIFEILLKNEGWTGMHDVKESEEFVEGNNSENPTQNHYENSQMMQDESIDKILGNTLKNTQI